VTPSKQDQQDQLPLLHRELSASRRRDSSALRPQAEARRVAALALALRAIPELNVRLDDRVQQFLAEERTVYIALAIGVSLAAYLVLGTVVSTRRSVRGLLGDLWTCAHRLSGEPLVSDGEGLVSASLDRCPRFPTRGEQ